MISVIALILASICSANMDVVTDHFKTSIYKSFNPIFFDHTKGSLGKKIFGYYFDFWHLNKTAMLSFICLAIVAYKPITSHWYLDLASLGAIWILTFDIFYGLFKGE